MPVLIRNTAVFMTLTLVGLVAYAQMPVTITSDLPAIAHHLETMAQWANQLDMMRKQFDATKEQYEAITGSYRRGEIGLTESLKSLSAIPGTWKDVVAKQQSGAYKTSGDSAEDVIKTMPQDLFRSPTGQDAATYKLSTDAVRAAMAGGDVLYAQVQINLNNLAVMANKVDTTSNTKDAADLQNRIAAENAILNSTMAKLSIMNINLQANLLNQQNQATAVNQSRYKRPL